ncbi:CHASE2 domain-containing protein [Phormidesmis sp. 146-35]
MRSQGFLQDCELKAYDFFTRLRPLEKELDEHILIVEITKDDLKEKSITNKELADLLSKLQKYKPRVIGLDIHRDESDKEVKQSLQAENVIATCIATGGKPSPASDRTTPPYKDFPENRLGFANFPQDKDNIYRRQLLTLPLLAGATCNTRFSLSFQIALAYLEKDGILPDTASGEQIKLIRTKELQNSSVLFQQLKEPSGGYENEEMPGYQILLNYRPSISTGEPFRKATLSEITGNRFDSKWINDKIVLIGYRLEDSNENPDTGLTPYSFSESPPKLVPGVVIHAHGISQIIDAAYGERSLLKVWSRWIEFLWILVWASTGGGVVLFFWHPFHLLASITTEVLVLTVVSIWLFQIIWVPFIPSTLAVLLTHLVAVAYIKLQRRDWNL